jgi:hypothetical protein
VGYPLQGGAALGGGQGEEQTAPPPTIPISFNRLQKRGGVGRFSNFSLGCGLEGPISATGIHPPTQTCTRGIFVFAHLAHPLTPAAASQRSRWSFPRVSTKIRPPLPTTALFDVNRIEQHTQIMRLKYRQSSTT